MLYSGPGLLGLLGLALLALGWVAGSFPSARRLRPYFSFSAAEPLASGPPAQKVHLSILPRIPKVED